MRLKQIDGDEVGLLADFHRAQFLVQSERLAAVDGCHLQHLAGRQKIRVLEMDALLVDRRFHVQKQIAVMCGR